VHVLAGTGRTQLLPFLIYAFTSLKLVAYYGNYMLLITKLSQLVNNFLGSTGAGVGNLIAEGDRKRILQVFWELNSLRFVIAGFFAFALYHLIDPFITVWLGTEYVLPRSVLIIILANFFVSQYRGTIDQFINGYGLFHDTWAPVTTLAITVIVALIGGSLWGLSGVLLGDIASSLTIICVWKAYFLYKEGFRMPVFLYWKNVGKYTALFLLSWAGADGILRLFPLFDPFGGYVAWTLYAIYSSTIFLAIFIPLFYLFSDGIRHLLRRIQSRISS
jgi:O-antigen/teichoic acid export membrane protein